ncbi:MAG: hypothetical protein AAB036_09860 [Elusimicrobiota bacterium]
MNVPRRLVRLLAPVLCAALIEASVAPQVWAQVGSIGAMRVPVSGAAASAAAPAASISAQALTTLPGIPAAPISSVASFLTSGLPTAVTPVATAQGSQAKPGVSALQSPLSAKAVSSPATEPVSQDQQAVAAGENSGSSPVDVDGAPRPALRKIQGVIKGVKAFFTGKSPESVPDAPQAQADRVGAAAHAGAKAQLTAADQSEVPSDKPGEPPPPPGPSQSAQKSINWFLGGLLVSQIGIEILGFAMPLLMRATFGGLAAVAQLAVYTSLASIVGQFAGGKIPATMIKMSFLSATVLRMLSIVTMVLFLSSLAGTLPAFIAAITPLAHLVALLQQLPIMSVMIGFNAFNGFVAGVALTAQKSIAPAILGSDRGTLERFASLKQWLSEIIGVLGPKAGSYIVQTFDFVAAIAMYPIMLGAAVAMYAYGVKIPSADAESANATRPKPSSKSWRALASWTRPVTAYAASFFNRLVAFIDALVLKAYLQRWIDQLGGKGNLDEADEQKLLTRSTLAWIKASMITLAGFLTLLLPTALPAYAAIFVFGVAQVMTSEKLYALILSRTKGKSEAVKVNAVSGATFTGVSALALVLSGVLFDAVPGIGSFVIFNGALAVMAAGLFLLRRMLQRTSEAGSPEPSPRPTGGFGLMFKDPVMRWAFLAYVVLTVLNPLLYQILAQAFGLFLTGGAALAASDVISWLTSIYSFGGLLGALYMWRESTLISNAKKPAVPPSQ